MKNYQVPETDLLSPPEALADYFSLRQALTAETDGEATLTVHLASGTLALVQQLVADGICASEAEVLNRAVRAFFVAVASHPLERRRILNEAAGDYQVAQH